MSCVSHPIVARYPTVVGPRWQHHVQLRLIRPSLSLIPGIEVQGDGVFITQVNFWSVTKREEPSSPEASEQLVTTGTNHGDINKE